MKKNSISNNGLRTWIEIDRKKIKHNYNIFRNLIPKKCQLMAIVKSNAYGHSLLDFSKEMEKLGADWLGVDSIVEAESLRKANIKTKILILGYTLPEKIPSAIKNNISLTVSNFENLKTLEKIKSAKPAKIHLKIDTGMHRQGFFVSDLQKVVNILKKNKKKILVEGIYTHFAAAKNPALPKDTLNQLSEFKKAVDIIKKASFNPIKHAAATSGTIIFPQAHFDMIRVGIGLYGMWPSKETQAAYQHKINLKPILSWKTKIGEVKKLKNGNKIGYDFTETLTRDSRIGILPIGYWHSYDRALSGIGPVVIKNKTTKVLGRISMDMTAIDLTKIKNARIGNEVILIGENNTADKLADLANTINYEITTRINPLIKRIYK
ncbi:MAG: alanine racemase [Patescibacteria group bacterium]